MPYSAKAIANYFLAKAREANRELTPMKLQKLVYFAQGWHLAVRNESLIDEQVEAWPYGPVIPTLYREFREFGDRPITFEATDCVPNGRGGLRFVRPSVDDQPHVAEFTKLFLDRIWDVYGAYSAIQLSNMTHKSGSPWDQVREEHAGQIPRGTDIPRSTITRYFLDLARSETSLS